MVPENDSCNGCGNDIDVWARMPAICYCARVNNFKQNGLGSDKEMFELENVFAKKATLL